MEKIFKAIYDIYETIPLENGELVEICKKRNVVTKRKLETNNIKCIEEHTDNKGRIYRTRCRVKYEDELIILNHSFEYISKITKPIIIKGFR